MAIQKITSNVLADGAVSASNLAAGSVSSAKLADNSITSAKLADNSITSAKLANNSVGIDQLNLSDGTDGQILTTNGSGTLSFADAGGGGGVWNVVSSTTLSSAATSVELTLSGYDSYEIRFDKMEPHTRTQGGVAEYLRVHFSTNGGTSYSTNVKHYMKYSQTRNNTTNHYWYGGSYGGSNTTNYIDLIDLYKSTTFDHSLSGFVSVENNATGTPQKHGEFKIINGRDYSSVIEYFFRNGYFAIEESSVINKVKFDLSGGASVPSGTRFVVYGLSTS